LFLRSLPPLIHIHGAAPAARPLRATVDLLTFETEAAHLGRSTISSSLCRIVLVNILRTHLESSTSNATGWLGALADPQIGTALTLMHGHLRRPWKVADLAREVAMSRTTFAERFKGLVGLAPMEYLTSWRMMTARRELQREHANLTTIARQVGYESDTAFSLAFKRTFGCSPGRYRSTARLRHESMEADAVVIEGS
jgi:AraC-like DNA-binding protein